MQRDQGSLRVLCGLWSKLRQVHELAASPVVEREAKQDCSVRTTQDCQVQITGKPCNSPTVKMEVKQPEGEPPIKWVKLQLATGATLFLRNTTVLDLSLLLNKIIG